MFILTNSLGPSVRLETAYKRLYMLRPVNWIFFVVCMGWQVRAIRVHNSPSPLLSLHTTDEVQRQVNGSHGWSKVSNSALFSRHISFVFGSK